MFEGDLEGTEFGGNEDDEVDDDMANMNVGDEDEDEDMEEVGEEENDEDVITQELWTVSCLFPETCD